MAVNVLEIFFFFTMTKSQQTNTSYIYKLRTKKITIIIIIIKSIGRNIMEEESTDQPTFGWFVGY